MKKDYIDESIQNALIKLAATKYVEEEGEKILEEARALNQVENEDLTKEQIKNFEELCKRELRKNKRKSRNYKMIFYRVAAVVAIVLIVANVSVVSVPAMRQAALGFLVQKYDTHMTIEKHPDEAVGPVLNVSDDRFDIVLSEEYEITYLPEGFKIQLMTKTLTGWDAEYYNQDKLVTFQQLPVDGASLGIDTEEAETKNIDINGNGALVSIKDMVVTITWKVSNSFILISGSNVEEEEIIKIAKSVKKVR